MKKDSVYENVIIIWEALSKNFALNHEELKNITKLDDSELIPALSWMFEMHEAFSIKINNEVKICLTENE